MTTAESGDASGLERRGLETVIRIGVVLLLLAWCFQILRPFIQPIAWGIIIAVATQGVYGRIEAAVGGRRRLAASLYILLACALLMVPALMLSRTLIDGVAALASDLRDDGALDIPPPPDAVATWPVLGERVHSLWHDASVNLASALNTIPNLEAVGSWLLSRAARIGFALFLFMVSIILAGFLLARADRGRQLARDIATRLAGDRGEEFVKLAASTVRSVARGVLGVALIQAILAGFGFLAVGLPAAGLWALVVFLAAVVQLPTFLVFAPVVVYVFATTSPTTEGGEATTSLTAAIAFAVWIALVGVSDNVLKPLLLGRGAPVPMLVIFIGVIGGFVVSGIIGLFTGAVVLSLGYKLFLAWLRPHALATD